MSTQPWNDFADVHRAELSGCMTRCRGGPVVRWHGEIPRQRAPTGGLQRVRTIGGDREGREERGRKGGGSGEQKGDRRSLGGRQGSGGGGEGEGMEGGGS